LISFYQFHTNLITNPLPALLFETPCTTVILKAINTIFHEGDKALTIYHAKVFDSLGTLP